MNETGISGAHDSERVRRDPTGECSVVVVDDDPSLCDLAQRFLEKAGYRVKVFNSGESCLAALTNMMPHAVCLDLTMPGMDGLETLGKLKDRHRLLPVIILTADSTISSAVQAMKLGAYDYLVKPIDRTKLTTTVKNAIERYHLSMRLTHLEREAEGQGYDGILGQSDSMKTLFRDMDRVAASDITVLIHGESGTGKELVARAIHRSSGRNTGTFVALNCAAIAETLQESEMFGHEKGAFTGADRQQIGKFELADRGVLFLDEIAELSASLQAKLLRALQERRFHRIGGTREVSSDFRLIAATNRDLLGEVQKGNFREDLYFRIAVFELEIPTLRERGQDIALLANAFLLQFGDRSAGLRSRLRFSSEALQLMQSYAWPGNVRELENVVQRSVLVCNGDLIVPEDLPSRLRTRSSDGDPAPQPPGASEEDSAGTSSESSESLGDAERSKRGISVEDAPLNLKALELWAIEKALKRAEGNLSEVVRMLGIGRATLYRKLKEHNLK
jgi:DNA-binding NtrC family response regulator